MRFLVAVLAAAMLIAPGQQAGPRMASGPSGGWSDAGNLSTERGGGIIGVLLGSGRVLVTGISGDVYSGLGNVDLYDPRAGWSLGPKLQGDPTGAAAAPLPGGGALLAGGVPSFGGTDGPGPGPVATAMVYNPSAGAWNKVPDMSVARTRSDSLGDRCQLPRLAAPGSNPGPRPNFEFNVLLVHGIDLIAQLSSVIVVS
jgi:hypothetical protein